MRPRQVRRLTGLLTLALIALATPVLYATPALALMQQVVVSAVSPSDPTDSKTVTVACPAGKKVVGGGGGLATPGNLPDAVGWVALTGWRPGSNSSGDYLEIRAQEEGNAFPANWYLAATAMCASPPAGWQIVSRESTSSSTSTRTVTANCPTGKIVIGFGGWITGSGPGRVHLTGVHPTPGLVGATATAAETEAGIGTNWTVTSYAICIAAEGPRVHVIHSSSPVFGATSTGGRELADECLPGSVASGVGARLVGDTRLVRLAFAFPNQDNVGRSVRIRAAPVPTAASTPFRLEVYLVCSPLQIFGPA
jgi:hypothetical protein